MLLIANPITKICIFCETRTKVAVLVCYKKKTGSKLLLNRLSYVNLIAHFYLVGFFS